MDSTCTINFSWWINDSYLGTEKIQLSHLDLHFRDWEIFEVVSILYDYLMIVSFWWELRANTDFRLRCGLHVRRTIWFSSWLSYLSQIWTTLSTKASQMSHLYSSRDEKRLRKSIGTRNISLTGDSMKSRDQDPWIGAALIKLIDRIQNYSYIAQ